MSPELYTKAIENVPPRIALCDLLADKSLFNCDASKKVGTRLAEEMWRPGARMLPALNTCIYTNPSFGPVNSPHT